MVEKRRRKKNRRLKNEENDRIKRMSMFGLRIETRDDFDENNYDDFKNTRREIKDKSHSYRIGPAPVTDYQIKPNHHIANAPGSLDSDLDDIDINNQLSQDGTGFNASKAGCRGLIMYFAKLGNSEGDEHIDLEFVDSLLRGGADINFPDRHGQTCLHEIARSWNTDVAQFALSRGADVNRPDSFGRTPLHLAAAVNYPEMVFWLISNGAKIEERTVGEYQTTVHYAAKNNGTDSLKVLLHMGGSISDVDYKNRTPLFVAAETGRAEACRFLLEQGAPCGVYDDCGTSALSLMVEKMPDVAKIALGQFEMVDKALRKKYYYLNYLEMDIWQRVASKHGKALRKSFARTPLETICSYNEAELITHAVILRLIAIKWQLFGKYHTALNTGMNLIYTILWTILGVTMPKTEVKHYYTPIGVNSWRIVLEIIGLGMAFYFIVMQILDFRRNESRSKRFKEWRNREIERDIQFCHPRWPEERRYLNSEMKMISTSSRSYMKNGWNVFEMITNIVMALVVFTRIIATASSNIDIDRVHYKSFPLLLIMLWLRFMKSCQCYQSLGPFITMLGHVITDTMKFGFLFFEFFIPYVCAFWILFGGIPDTEFEYFNDLVYHVFLMTLVDEYDRQDIMEQDKVMAQILVGTYLAIASVVCVNLYIALMSQTFTRIYQNAKATAFMQQAKHLLKIERTLGKSRKLRVKKFMNSECSPQVIYDTGMGDDDDDDGNKLMLYRMFQSINEIKDKVLVLMVNTTKANEKNEGDESPMMTTLDDVIVQVDMVRKKCESLECQLDDLQELLSETKQLMEAKVLVDEVKFASVEEIKQIIQSNKSDNDAQENFTPRSGLQIPSSGNDNRKSYDNRKSWEGKISKMLETMNQNNQSQKSRYERLKDSSDVTQKPPANESPRSPGYQRFDSSVDNSAFPFPHDSFAAYRMRMKEPRTFYSQDSLSYDPYLMRDFEEFQRFKGLRQQQNFFSVSPTQRYIAPEDYHYQTLPVRRPSLQVEEDARYLSALQKRHYDTDDGFYRDRSQTLRGKQREDSGSFSRCKSDQSYYDSDYSSNNSRGKIRKVSRPRYSHERRRQSVTDMLTEKKKRSSTAPKERHRQFENTRDTEDSLDDYDYEVTPDEIDLVQDNGYQKTKTSNAYDSQNHGDVPLDSASYYVKKSKHDQAGLKSDTSKTERPQVAADTESIERPQVADTESIEEATDTDMKHVGALLERYGIDLGYYQESDDEMLKYVEKNNKEKPSSPLVFANDNVLTNNKRLTDTNFDKNNIAIHTNSMQHENSNTHLELPMVEMNGDESADNDDLETSPLILEEEIEKIKIIPRRRSNSRRNRSGSKLKQKNIMKDTKL